MRTRFLAPLAASVALASCGGGGTSGATPPGPPSGPPSRQGIAHIVVLVQENRTFNDLFATFPGAVGTTTGKMRVGSGANAKTVNVALQKVSLTQSNMLRHNYPSYRTAYRDGNMDAFNQIVFERNGQPEGKLPYQYVDPNRVAPYWSLATQYGLADHTFQTQGSGSFTAHQALIAGGTQIDSTHSLVDDPSQAPWGCPAPPGARTSLITTTLQYEPGAGPFPCLSYKTVADLLDAKGVSWKYYTPTYKNLAPGALWNAFLAISDVYGNSNEWNAHVATPETRIFDDISNGDAARGFLADSRRRQLGSSGLRIGYGSVVGSERGQRHRAQLVLGLDGYRRRVGRLGWILRSRCTAETRRSRRPRFSRSDDRRLSVRAA